MSQTADPSSPVQAVDTGLRALCSIAGYYRIAADPDQLRRELALGEHVATEEDLVRVAARIGLKARIVRHASPGRLAAMPVPALVRLREAGFAIFGGRTPSGEYRVVDLVTRIPRDLALPDLVAAIEPTVVLVQRRFRGEGVDPKTFGFQWFLPSLWRYRKPLAHVMLASLVVQIFALVTPLFFQVVVDKVLVHKGYSTLVVIVAALAIIGLFDVALQYLRTYALAHTTNRIDVELGRRLFQHLLRLPLSYFETRPDRPSPACASWRRSAPS